MIQFFVDFVQNADFIIPLIIASLVPLTIVAMGALYSERSGVVNIALEGIMIMGAYSGAVILRLFENNFSADPQIAILAALIVGTLIGALYSLLHAFAAINMKADQIISATALNLFAVAFVIFVERVFTGNQRVVLLDSYMIQKVGFLSEIPFIGPLFFSNAYITSYIGIIVFIVLAVILYKTKAGLRLRACGENPHAADSLGLNVTKIRYAGVLVSGAMAGFGGVTFLISFAKEFNASVAGFGFLALAVLIFGNWKPGRIVLASLFFATMRVIASASGVFDSLTSINIPTEVYRMLPYLATILVLAFVSKNSAAPKAAGEPYDKGKR
jgi:ABC-type uncharacterized transport system permease subunit